MFLRFLILATVLLAVFSPDLLAQEGLNERSQAIASQLSGFQLLLVNLAGLVGLYFVVVNVFAMGKDEQQSREEKTKMVGKIIVGVVLMSVWTFVQFATTTVVGNTAEQELLKDQLRNSQGNSTGGTTGGTTGGSA